MSRILTFSFAMIAYAIFFATFLYMICFVGDLVFVPRTVDVGPEAPVPLAIVIDALLGTGSSGAPRGDLARALETIPLARKRQASVVAIDLPSGLDATTGVATGTHSADVTLTFGDVKRGHLVARVLR